VNKSIALILLLACASAVADTPTSTAVAPNASAASAPAGGTASAPSQAVDSLLPWSTDYAAAIARARQQGRPILVRAGAVWCRWCKELDKEIAQPEVQAELRRWVLIEINVDRPPAEARTLAIGPVPALRILSSSGRLVDSHDGYMEAADLLNWLRDKYSSAGPPLSPAVSSSGDSAAVIQQLVNDLDRRDPAVREAAIRRLILVPGKAAGPLVEALKNGNLATRLGALEILREWGGPTDGLDPWDPESFTDARLEALQAWAKQPDKIVASRPAELSDAQRELVQRDVARLLAEDVSAAEAEAIRERLARYGELVLPSVYDALRLAASDSARERLTCLRYRLVASDNLVFSWPGGLERLSSMEVGTRHAAVDELVSRCGAADEPLLLELFSDPDGLVREIALRGLQKVGGSQVSSALIRLLQDPEPNVRAAVLKQMAESPSAKVVQHIAEYVVTEPDPDLVVHAIRVLRATKGKAAAECLMTLFRHPNWQVRAEAVEALGEIVNAGSELTSKLKKDTGAALLEVLDDSDGFVVSVAVKALGNAEVSDSVDALARAADKHPELAADVLRILNESYVLRTKAIPHMRRFCRHEQAIVRAVAITVLCEAAPHNVEKEMVAALGDPASRVRIAAATALLDLMELHRPQRDDDAAVHLQAHEVSGGLLSSFFRGFRKSSSRTAPADTQPAATAPAALSTLTTLPEGSVLVITVESPGTQPSTSQPVVASGPAHGSTPPKERSKQEQWLDDFRSGKKRPKWMDATIPLLEPMLTAESPEERLAAAIDLIALGRDDVALPVLLAAVKLRPELAGTAAGALPWLTWDRRLAVFEELTKRSAGPAAVMQIAQKMSVWTDPRSAQPLWSMLGDESMTVVSAGRILDALRRIYFGDHSYRASSAPADQRRQAIADAVPRAQSGPEFQRLTALALLLSVSLSDASEQAEAVMADAGASAALRRDALQIRLLSQTRTGAQKLAVQMLADSDPGLRTVALEFLAEGPDSRLRNGGMYLYFQNPAIQTEVVSSGQPIRVTAPADLKAELLVPLLGDPDPRAAARAAYLLATLKDSAGLDTLIRYWREQARDDHAVRRMVYRAITALNDDSRTAVLEEVYRTYAKDDYWLRDFYWTIRSMSGPNVLALRKQIRDEVGMESLR